MAALTGLSGNSGLSGIAGGGASMIPWTPAVEPSLRFFLDATDAATITGSGGTLASWANKAPLGGTFTPLTAQAPTYGSGVVTFPFGVISSLVSPSRFGIATNPNLTVVAICTPTVTTDQRLVAVGMNSGVATPGAVQTQININDVAWRYDNGGSIFLGGGSSAKTLFAMSRPSGSYANATARRNGSQLPLTTQGSDTTSPTSTLDSTLIARGSWSGDVFGILAFESADSALIERAEGWAARYFSVSNELLNALDANHPWKNAPPSYSGDGLDVDASAYIAAVEAADGQPLEAGVRAAINEFIVGCKSDPSPNAGVSNFQAIEASCLLMGARTLSGALVPLRGVAPTNVGFIESQYSRTTGLLGNQSAYLNSNRNNNADPQNNNHNALYISSIGNGIALMGAGVIDAGTNSFTTSGVVRNRNRQAFTVDSLVAPLFLGTSRNSSAGYSAKGSGSVETPSTTSQTPVAQIMFIFSRQTVAGVPDQTTASRIAYYSIGRAVDLAALDARVTTLRNAIASALA